MSAHDQMRSMLDQLMGTARDGETSRDRIQFDDDRVCKSFLLNCCPHDILASTRMDLGECSKVHDMALRADFETASKRRDYYYDIDAMEHLDGFIKDCDRKTEMAKRRLKETQEELSEEANSKADTIHALGEQIGTKLAKAEELGAEGNVEESLTMMAEVEALNQEKSKAETEFRNSMPASRYQQQKLRVCEVCCAFLGIHDNDQQLADHFGGKLHLGFIAIREKLDDLKKCIQERKEKRDKERDERHRERSRSGSRSRRRHRSRSRSRSRRSRSRSRHRRSRSREYRRRSRDRRRRRSRSRSRSSRKRSHRSRSRSGSRSHKSKRHERRRGSPSDRSPRAENGNGRSIEDDD